MLSEEQKFEIQKLREMGEIVAPCDGSEEIRHINALPEKWKNCDTWVIKPCKGFGYIWFANKEYAQTWLVRVSEEAPEVLNKLLISFFEDCTAQVLFKKFQVSSVPEVLACGSDDNALSFKIFRAGRFPAWAPLPLGEEQREPASWVSLDVDLEGDYNTVPLRRLEEVTVDEYELMLSVAREQNEYERIALVNQWLIYSDKLWVTPMRENGCFAKDWPNVKNTVETVIKERYLQYNLGVVLHDNLVAFDVDNDGPRILHEILEKIQTERPELCQKLYAEQSKSGGGHIIVKRAGITTKKAVIAERFGVKGRVDKHKTPEDPVKKITLIEVLANGHAVCVAPSPGYVAFPGFCQLHELSELSDAEWSWLENTARSFSQFPVKEVLDRPRVATQHTVSPDIPEGAVICDVKEFWKHCSFADFDALLTRLGWTRITPVTGCEDDLPDSEQIKYRRPGKVRGESANLRRICGVWKFYNFSSSVKDGDVEGSGYPGTRTKLEFGGDWRKCYTVLTEEMWQSRQVRNLSFFNSNLIR